MRVPALVVISGLVAILPMALASADGTVPLGGGAGIVVAGSFCTLTTIGKDSAGEVVGITAASCGGPGAQVVAEGAEYLGSIGTVATVDSSLDYAVIKFDSAQVAPVANFDGFPINGVGPDPVFGQTVCMLGGATGLGCGFAKFVGLTPAIDAADMPSWQPGDTGAPVTVDTQLVGMTRHGFTGLIGPPPRLSTHTSFVLFSAILDAINRSGGLGAGFTPIQA